MNLGKLLLYLKQYNFIKYACGDLCSKTNSIFNLLFGEFITPGKNFLHVISTF